MVVLHMGAVLVHKSSFISKLESKAQADVCCPWTGGLGLVRVQYSSTSRIFSCSTGCGCDLLCRSKLDKVSLHVVQRYNSSSVVLRSIIVPLLTVLNCHGTSRIVRFPSINIILPGIWYYNIVV